MNLSLLIAAMVLVESEGDPSKVGACGGIGPLQITPICLRDINRICQKTGDAKRIYTTADCRDLDKSIEMMMLYTDYYLERFELEGTAEERARIWNGGPRGYQKDSTEGYWQKVQKKSICVRLIAEVLR